MSKKYWENPLVTTVAGGAMGGFLANMGTRFLPEDISLSSTMRVLLFVVAAIAGAGAFYYLARWLFGRTPKICHLPHGRNDNFTGRKGELKEIRKALRAHKSPACVALHGIGGVGKTQTAVEYVHRHMKRYDAVWWIVAEEPAAISLAGLARALGIEVEKIDPQSLVPIVHSQLNDLGRWLLVFDNAERPEDIERFIPKTGSGSVLVTSRNPNWEKMGATTVEIEPLSPEDSADLLIARSGDKDHEAAGELAEELDNLPLALEQAAAYCAANKTTLAQYLDIYRKDRIKLFERSPKPLGYPKSVATTWNVSLEVLEREKPQAANLLKLLSFLAPDDVPEWLLKDHAEVLDGKLAAALKGDAAFIEMRGALIGYSLVTAESDSLSMHRLLQEAVRDRLTDDEKKAWAVAAVGLVNDAIPGDTDDVRTWPVVEPLIAHGLAAAAHGERYGAEQSKIVRIIGQLGIYFRGRAEYEDAKNLFQRTLEADVRAFGENHPTVGRDLNNLANVLRDQGDLNGARKLLEQALDIHTAAFGEDHPNVATDVSNLANVLADQGDLKEAKELYERALGIDTAAFGENHPNVAMRLNNLGTVLRDQGDLGEAKKLHERALKIDTAAFGEDHPNVARDSNNLGVVLRNQGDLKEAKKLHERALEIDTAAFGEDHPDVACDLDDLAIVLAENGDLEGAKKLQERALEIYRARLGEDHPETRRIQGNLEETIRRMEGGEGDGAGA